MIQENILDLVDYGLATGLVEPADKAYTINRLLELFEVDDIEDAVFEVTVAGLPCKVSVTDRKVVGRERITVPAGTFDCVVVLEHKSQRLGKLVVSYAYTWYAAGIGMIRHDTYVKGSLKTTERLVSLTMPE